MYCVGAAEPIGIGLIQRYVADWEQKQQNKEKPSMLTDTEKTIAIIGAGPAGLASSSSF